MIIQKRNFEIILFEEMCIRSGLDCRSLAEEWEFKVASFSVSRLFLVKYLQRNRVSDREDLVFAVIIMSYLKILKVLVI